MMRNRLFLIIGLLCTTQIMLAYTWSGNGLFSANYNLSWYNATDDTLYISTNAQLGGLARKVNVDKELFEGKVIILTSDVNMNANAWTPIEGFKGVLEGNGHVISNLKGGRSGGILSGTVYSNGLFANLNGGTVKNLMIDGEIRDINGIGGGIIATLNGGTIENCAYVGTIESGSDDVILGGLVGKIDEENGGTIINSYYCGVTRITNEDVTFGTIVGNHSIGTLESCYFFDNGYYSLGVGSGEQTGTYGKSENSFLEGEIAWILNQNESEYCVWGQGASYPVFANETNKPVYKINYSEDETYKFISKEYAVEDSEVIVQAEAAEYYTLVGYSSEEGVELRADTLVMPGFDVTVRANTVLSEITAYPAQKISHNSFLAVWNSIKGATGYAITVKQGENIVRPYNEYETGLTTSFKVEGLSAGVTYTYTISVIRDGKVEEPSNEIEVTTDDKQWEVVNVEKYSFTAVWSAVEDAEKYIISLYQGENVVSGYNNIETQATSYDFVGLSHNTEYVVHFSVVSADAVEAWENLVVVTTGDYGHQLNNSGFEAWEGTGDNEEPVDWNSFMTADISVLGPFGGFVKTVHMKQSDVTRPDTWGNISTRIWSTKTLIGVIANGNLTCGRIFAVSTDVKDGMNHNKSIISNPDFSEAIYGATPDSLTVWVKYVPNVEKDKTYIARVAATIHDSYDYSDPSNYDPASEIHVVAKATLNYEATEDHGWQRLSIPFEYTGPATDADYMLVTFTTNETPGGGSENDEVYIDDLVLIYKPILEINTDNKKEFSRGGKLVIDYTLEGTMSPTNLPGESNTATLEFLKSGDSFDADNAVIEEWATITTDYSGTFIVDIPEDFEMGDYKVRIVTTNYPMISEPYDIHIGLPAPVALEAEEVDEESFLAVWEVADEGVDYRLTVKLYDEFVVKGYENLLIENIEELIERGQVLYRVESLERNRPYTYTVQAVFGEYRSEESNKISVRTSGENPEPERVTVLEATNVGATEFTAVWEATSPVEEYLLTVKLNGEIVEGYNAVSTAMETTYKVTGLQPETQYTYLVVARSGEYSSVPSLEMAVTTDKYVPEATVATEATDVAMNSFVANWEADEFATNYILTVKKDGEALANYDGIYTGNVTEYIVNEGIEPETEYVYSVKVVAKDEISEESNEIKVTTEPDLTSIDNNFITNLSVYPSPAVDYIYLEGVTDGIIYRVTNIAGSLVSTGILTGERVDVSSLSTGVYFIEVSNAKAKFVKE